MTCYKDPVSCFFNHFYFCSVQQFICWLITLNSWRLDFYTLLGLVYLIMWRTLYPCSMALLMFQCKAWDTYQGTLSWQHSNCNICLFWDWWQLKNFCSAFLAFQLVCYIRFLGTFPSHAQFMDFQKLAGNL